MLELRLALLHPQIPQKQCNGDESNCRGSATETGAFNSSPSNYTTKKPYRSHRGVSMKRRIVPSPEARACDGHRLAPPIDLKRAQSSARSVDICSRSHHSTPDLSPDPNCLCAPALAFPFLFVTKPQLLSCPSPDANACSYFDWS